MARKKFVIGCFKEENMLFEAIKTIRGKDTKIYNVFTPFPVHGLDKALGLKDTKLHTLGFVYGMLVFLFTLGAMYWVLNIDWPIIYGGKSYFPMLAFVPILFEFVILMTAIGLVLTFCYWCKLGPFVKRHHFHPHATNDTFVVVLLCKDAKDEQKYMDIMQQTGAEEINTQYVDDGWWFGSYGNTMTLYKEKGQEVIQ